MKREALGLRKANLVNLLQMIIEGEYELTLVSKDGKPINVCTSHEFKWLQRHNRRVLIATIMTKITEINQELRGM